MSAGDGSEPALWKHLQQDDSAKVSQLLAARADVAETAPPFRWTALHAAAGYGALRSCEVLLQAKADVDAVASDGETPLHLAAQSGEEKAIRLIVAARANVNAPSEDRETPLHVAVQHLGGKALSHVAALVELRADPKLCNEDGQNALALARIMTNRADEIIDVLSGGRPTIKDVQNSAASSAAGRSSDELEKVLSTACHRGQVDVVKQLLKLLPAQSVKAAASRSMVPAAASGLVEVGEALLAVGADVSTTAADEQRTSPLIAAADEGATRMLRWLLSHGADVESTSRDGATALMAVSSRGSTDGVEVLLSAKANPDQQATNGWTALMFAAQQGRLEVARRLLDAKADLGCSNADGATARSLAAVAGHGELAKLFDTRARLVARRAKASQDSGVVASATDTRDLDSLLATMGEGSKTSAPKSTKGGKKSKRAKGPNETEDLPELKETSASTVVRAEVSSKDPMLEHSVVEASLQTDAKTNLTTDQEDAQDVAEATEVEEVSQASVGIDAKLRSLTARLKSVALRRAQLDAEEAELIQELEGLGVA
eukprot:TRINITY_DN18313_c0_g1_i1.p1 TRINITY_DN18313_c0_g1~~TRINITY_DN18313_c0_g1_i1.p1  ORF type:complete len:546 (+),score=143.80 TRINITY_DN18313_c0_g1_i1:66-1703(+)